MRRIWSRAFARAGTGIDRDSKILSNTSVGLSLPKHERQMKARFHSHPTRFLRPAHRPLYGKRVLITAGPTYEAIDPVRYIANRSSGRQGFAIAQAAAEMGADVISSLAPWIS